MSKPQLGHWFQGSAYFVFNHVCRIRYAPVLNNHDVQALKPDAWNVNRAPGLPKTTQPGTAIETPGGLLPSERW